jgi:hypothetical protein
MQLSKLDNKSLIVDVLNTTRIVKNNDSNNDFLAIDIMFSRSRRIIEIDHIIFVINNFSKKINFVPVMLDENNICSVFINIPEIDNYDVKNNNAFSIFVVNNHNKILDSFINKNFNSFQKEKTLNSLINDSRNPETISFEEYDFFQSFYDSTLYVSRIVDIGNNSLSFNILIGNLFNYSFFISYSNNKIQKSSNNNSNNDIIFSINDQHKEFIQSICNDILLEKEIIIEFGIENQDRSYFKEYILTNSDKDNILSFYRDRLLKYDFIDKISITSNKILDSNGIELFFDFSDLSLNDINLLYIEEIINEQNNIIQSIWGDKSKSDENKINFENTLLKDLLVNNKLIIFVNDNNVNINKIKIKFYENKYFVKETNKTSRISSFTSITSDYDNIYSTTSIDNNFVSEYVRSIGNSSNLNIEFFDNSFNKGLFYSYNIKLNLVRLIQTPEITDLANRLNYKNTDADGIVTIRVEDMLKSGMYFINHGFTLISESDINKREFYDKSLVLFYEDIFGERKENLNNILFNSFRNINLNKNITELFSNTNVNNKIEIYKNTKDFKIDYFISIYPIFDFKNTFKHRFKGFDDKILRENNIHVIPNIDNNQEINDSNKILNQYITTILGENYNDNTYQLVVKNYLKENPSNEEKNTLCRILSNNLYKQNNLGYNYNKSISLEDIVNSIESSLEDSESINDIKMNSHNILLISELPDKILFGAQQEFFKSKNRRYNYSTSIKRNIHIYLESDFFTDRLYYFNFDYSIDVDIFEKNDNYTDEHTMLLENNIRFLKEFMNSSSNSMFNHYKIRKKAKKINNNIIELSITPQEFGKKYINEESFNILLNKNKSYLTNNNTRFVLKGIKLYLNLYNSRYDKIKEFVLVINDIKEGITVNLDNNNTSNSYYEIITS